MLPEVWPFVDACHRAGLPVALARLVGRDGPGSRPLGATMAVAADGTWRGSVSGGCVEGIVLGAARTVLDGFVQELPRRRRLVLVGATDLASTLANLAGPLRRRIIVLDPRLGHVASGAIPTDAELVQAWPDEWIAAHPLRRADALIVLTHDPRIDDRAIRAALAGDVGYVAALGSRATHRQRLHRLDGIPELERIIGPAGLDLGGSSLAETALSILAELVAADNVRDGRPLRDGDLPIRAVPESAACAD